MKRIAIIGAGNWGTALAIIAGRAGHDVHLWARSATVSEHINRAHTNPQYLKDREVPDAVRATCDASEAVADADVIILSTPSHALRQVLVNVAPFVSKHSIVVSATKGIEVDTGKRISELVQEILGERSREHFVCLSGP